jgi:hypothetical protein
VSGGANQKIVALLCALLAFGAGCSGYQRAGSKPKARKANSSYGSADDDPLVITPQKVPQRSIKSKTTGELQMQVLDDHNRVLPGAIVHYKGPQTGQAVTNAKGEIHVMLKPGSYEIDLAPCGTTVITKTQQKASAVVVAGSKTPLGYLNGIEWVRRFTPADQGRTSKAPPWHKGDVVEVGLGVQDGCTFALAKNFPIPTFAWKLSSGYAFARAPVYKTDGSGFATASVRCVSKPSGSESIKLYDRAAPANSADIMLATSTPPAGHDWCE